MILTDIVVHGSIGAGGNHVRWLLLMDKKFSFFDLQTIEEKIKFIQDSVYPQARNHKNWLTYEWKYRKQLDQWISFKHTEWSNGWEYRTENFSKYNIYVNSKDVELILKLYSKFNPTLNNTSREEFLRQALNDHNESVCCLNNWHKGILVDTKLLYRRTLDKDLYHSMVNYCELDDNYEYCKEIHERWFSIHKESGQDGNAADC